MQISEIDHDTNVGTAVTVLAEERGASRLRSITTWLRQADEAGADTWRLACAPEAGGVWAGLADLIESIVAEIEAGAPHLLAGHAYEIALVLPQRRHDFHADRPLTDTAEPEERTRNYAADRAYRSLHGLIDLLGDWHRESGGRPWAIACDDYDRANGLVLRFFRELARRRGAELGLRLLLAVDPDRAADIAADLDDAPIRRVTRVAPTGRTSGDGDDRPVAREEMTARALALEASVTGDEMDDYVGFPQLIHCWRHSTQPGRALRWEVDAMNVFNHFGLYEASLELADAVEAGLEQLAASDGDGYFKAVNGLYFCLVPLGQAERAGALIETSLDRVDRRLLPRLLYLASMLHARFLGTDDLGRAEAYLHRALEVVARVELPADESEFLTVFLMNGLALIRVRQRRPDDALALCQAGLDRLAAKLGPTQHRLHHSVLLFNIAQVYAQIGPFDKALDYLGQTMDMDPNYSEYYNDRGAVYCKLDRLAEAEADFRTAISLSPPYAEVWVNLGQCYRGMGRMSDAVVAYSRALDLDPGSALAWAGRAEALADLGSDQDAQRDYSRALELDPSDPLVWAARAIVRYGLGDVNDALHDLDRAVELAPETGELRQNRALARRDLGLVDGAAEDLQRYLELCPRALDRIEVENQLRAMTATPTG